MTLLQFLGDCFLHCLSQVSEPPFNIDTTSLDSFVELNNLGFFGDHFGDGVFSEFKLDDTIEKRLQVEANNGAVLRIGQDLNQIFTREEVEAREDLSLGLNVLVKLLLNPLEVRVELLERIDQVWSGPDDLESLWVLVCLDVQLVESLVD